MKEFKIEVPKGYEIDKDKSTFEKIVFKKGKKELPTTWEELRYVDGYFIDYDSSIHETIGEYLDMNDENKNIFPTKEEAEASIALAQLCQLRDRYNDGWKADWSDNTTFKYVLYYFGDEIKETYNINCAEVLYFKTSGLRDRFLENFRELIEIAKPLL